MPIITVKINDVEERNAKWKCQAITNTGNDYPSKDPLNSDIFYLRVRTLLRIKSVTTSLHRTNCFPIPLWKWEICILHGSKHRKSEAKTFAFDHTSERKDIFWILWTNDWLWNIAFQINELRCKRQELERRHSVVLEEKHAVTCSLEESQERILMLEKSKREMEQTVSL